MADADGRKIPWVEGDQGEGIKDFLDDYIDDSPFGPLKQRGFDGLYNEVDE